MRRPTRRAILAVVIAATLSASASREPSATAQTEAIEVGLGEYAFTPSAIAAPAGTLTLNVTNWGNRRHNMVVFVDGIELELPGLRPGEATTWELQLERPGTYQFWCGEYRHLERGMVGEITVE